MTLEEINAERLRVQARMKANNMEFFYKNPSAKINNSPEYISMKNELYALDIQAMAIKEEANGNH